jgi:hypothetical protein
VRGRVARMMMIYRVNFGFHFPFLDFFSFFFFSFLEIVYNNTVRVFSLTKKNWKRGKDRQRIRIYLNHTT